MLEEWQAVLAATEAGLDASLVEMGWNGGAQRLATLAVGGTVLAVEIARWWRRLARRAGRVATTGLVVGVDAPEKGPERLVFRFLTPDGTVVEGSDVSRVRLEPGDRVSVLYRPSDPAEARIPPRVGPMACRLAVVGAASLVFMGYGIGLDRVADVALATAGPGAG